MVKVEKERWEDVSDIQSFEGIVYNATKQKYKTKVKFLGIPIWASMEIVDITIPEQNKKNSKVGFKKD
jgi:hypothetical protein